jgi:alpha-glucoside transport system substrate-binding protein
LGRDVKRAAKQVLLRLVTVGDGVADTRRLVLRAELLSLPFERRAIEGVIDLFGRHRLLAFDRDPTTRGPTVEVAHEALLGSWDRLRIWIDEARTDLVQHRRLMTASAEWEASGRDPGLLPRGRRLEELSSWASSSELTLSRDEKEFVSEGERQRDQELALERGRADRERALERRSVVRLRALVAVMAAAALVAAGLTAIAVNRAGEAERLHDEGRIAALTGSALSNLDADPELGVLLALHAVNLSASRGEPVPSQTVEALHWGFQEARISYPAEDSPTNVKVVAGPLGTRGVIDLPVGQLANAARVAVTRDLTPAECARFFAGEACPRLPSTFAPDLEAEAIIPVPPPPGAPKPPLFGSQVSLVWGVHDDPEFFEPFQQELEAFTQETGVEVNFVSFPELDSWITAEQAGSDPPDIAYATPGILADFAREGHLVDLGAFVDVEELRSVQSPYLVSLGTLGPEGTWPAEEGQLFGAFNSIGVKSVVWYPVPEFRSSGYRSPTTWEELVDLTDRLRSDGRTPWCMGLESDTEDGWPATDWIENLVLADAGLETYDAWTFHDLPFDSPPIRRAFERFGDVVFSEGSVLGGPEGASETGFWEAQGPMLEDPPGCWLYQFPTFATASLPSGAAGRMTDVFRFPPKGGQRSGLVGSGDMFGAFSDRPEVRALIRHFLSPSHGVIAARLGLEFMSPHRDFDLDNYPPFFRRQAVLLRAALADDTLRFDASDLMPSPIGDDLFFAAMMQYVRGGPDTLDEVLADLDAAWPDTG